MATADEAIAMLQEVLFIDHDPEVTLLVSYSPAALLRKQADDIDRKEALRHRAWELVRAHRRSPEQNGPRSREG